jgi:hypothetical protein
MFWQAFQGYSGAVAEAQVITKLNVPNGHGWKVSREPQDEKSTTKIGAISTLSGLKDAVGMVVVRKKGGWAALTALCLQRGYMTVTEQS